MKPFVSICIPSFNRPLELVRLLESIPESSAADLEVLIAEDNSPKRNQVREAVAAFRTKTRLNIIYRENDKNLGYDGNLRQLAQDASGEFIIYMGDDDAFESQNVGQFIAFLRSNRHCGYVLKTHTFVHENGTKEPFKYYPASRLFEPGVEAFRQLFRKSVFVSGFCFRRDAAEEFHTDRFDGTLLYQLFLLAEIVMKCPSAFCETPLTIQAAHWRGQPMFGSSETERQLYQPGRITVLNSVNFMKGYLKVARYMDERYSIGAEEFLVWEISKYSYPVIAIQRWRGRREFGRYCAMLREEIRIDASAYYHVYFWGLWFCGKDICDMIIVALKRMIGSTPRL